MSDHAQKNHPIAGFIAAIAFGVIVYALMGAMNGFDKAAIVLPFFVSWAVISLAIFRTAGDDSDH